MKGRITSALFIIVGLSVGFCLGEYYVMNLLVIGCLFMAILELYAAQQYLAWTIQNGWAKFARNAWACQIAVLYGAVFSVVILNYKVITAIILCAFVSDVCAFAVGKTIGKHKVSWLKSISPNKSYEGYIGGIVLAWPLSWLIFSLLGVTLGASEIIYITLAGLLAEVGDLLGSAAKRALALKDSNEFAKLMPIVKYVEMPLAGHGGYLDRFDSVALSLFVYFVLYGICG